MQKYRAHYTHKVAATSCRCGHGIEHRRVRATARAGIRGAHVGTRHPVGSPPNSRHGRSAVVAGKSREQIVHPSPITCV